MIVQLCSETRMLTVMYVYVYTTHFDLFNQLQKEGSSQLDCCLFSCVYYVIVPILTDFCFSVLVARGGSSVVVPFFFVNTLPLTVFFHRRNETRRCETKKIQLQNNHMSVSKEQ